MHAARRCVAVDIICLNGLNNSFYSHIQRLALATITEIILQD